MTSGHRSGWCGVDTSTERSAMGPDRSPMRPAPLKWVLALVLALGVAWGATPAPAQNLPFIAGFYQNVLGRAPDSAGLESWRAFIAADCTPPTVATAFESFFDSPEFRATRPLTMEGLVTTLYRTILRRDPDGAGLDAFVDSVRRVRRQIAIQGFVPSPEFQSLVPNRADRTAVTALVTRLYQQILERAADPAGLTAWVDYITQTGDLEGAALGFLESAEFEARPLSLQEYVRILYRTFLGREADAAGLAAWENVLRQHLVMLIRHVFITSPEFAIFINEICGTAAPTTLTFFAPPELPPATVDEPYQFSFCVPVPTNVSDLCPSNLQEPLSPAGGQRPYHFQLDSGAGFPPFGLSLQLNGLLTGAPSVAGTWTFRPCAVDLAGRQACQTVTLTVRPQPAPTPTDPLTGHWSGPWNSTGPGDGGCIYSNSGTLTMDITSNGSTFSGTATISGIELRLIPGCSFVDFTTASGTVSGTISGSTIVLDFSVFVVESGHDFTPSFTGTLSGTTMSGPKTGGSPGAFSMTKQ